MSAIIFKTKAGTDQAVTEVWATDDITDSDNQAAGVTAFLTESLATDEYLVANARLITVGTGLITVAIRRFVDGVDSVIVQEPNRATETYATGSAASVTAIQERMARLFSGQAGEVA